MRHGTSTGDDRSAPFRFYLKEAPRELLAPVVPSDLSIAYWRPAWMSFPPRAVRSPVQWVWWAMHLARLFGNRDFTLVMIMRQGQLIHRSAVFPPFARFPFMRRLDLQIGDTWTAEAERGRGIAGLAIRAALHIHGRDGRRFWYVTEDQNSASIRVIEKLGFRIVGRGRRLPRFGLRALGFYAITEPSLHTNNFLESDESAQ